jgi:hypothetical protein
VAEQGVCITEVAPSEASRGGGTGPFLGAEADFKLAERLSKSNRMGSD